MNRNDIVSTLLVHVLILSGLNGIQRYQGLIDVEGLWVFLSADLLEKARLKFCFSREDSMYVCP